MIIEWNNSYSVGIKTFDEQHKKLFNYLKILHDAIKEKRKKDAMGEVLDGLLNYTITHFTVEEQAMLKHGYPEYEQHKKEHDRLTSKVREFHNRFHAQDAMITVGVLGFILKWLQDHIGETDKKYTPFFEGKEIK